MAAEPVEQAVTRPDLHPLHSASGDSRRPRELALSAAWHAALVPTVETTDGRTIQVVFRGVWTHGFGPDFRDAMLAFPDGELRTGAVEIHHRTGDWRAHGHHLDPNYDAVILHLVRHDDGAETRRADGALVPTALLPVPTETLLALDQRLPGIWDRLGGAVCAESLTRTQPARVRDALNHLGDRRLAERTARFEAELASRPPAAALLRGLFDALGFADNRSPMQAVADAIALPDLEMRLAHQSVDKRFISTLALMLGTGGFLPLSPADAAAGHLSPEIVSRVEHRWGEIGAPWIDRVVTATAWQRARVRPANHPALRLVQAATLLATTRGDLITALLDPLRHDGDPVERLSSLSRHGESPPLGRDRAISTVASVILPFALAYAEHTGDAELADRATAAWEALPAAALSRPVKRARRQVSGDAPLPRPGERGHQGLLLLDRTLCTPRRCYECPIAHEVLLEELRMEGRSEHG